MIFVHLTQTASAPPTDIAALESAISALERDISALEKCINSLSSSSLPWEHRALWSSALVVLGVLMELWVIWQEWRDDGETWALSYGFGILRLPARPSACKLWVEIGSVVFIAAGILGEMGAGLEIASINKSLRTKNELLQAKGDELRVDSDQLVELLRKEIAELKIEGAENREQLNTEYLQLGILKNSVATEGPRSQLLEDNKAEFIKALKPFAPQRIILVRCELEGEAKSEANMLERDLLMFLGTAELPGGQWRNSRVLRHGTIAKQQLGVTHRPSPEG